jgi:hypothetical protein
LPEGGGGARHRRKINYPKLPSSARMNADPTYAPHFDSVLLPTAQGVIWNLAGRAGINDGRHRVVLIFVGRPRRFRPSRGGVPRPSRSRISINPGPRRFHGGSCSRLLSSWSISPSNPALRACDSAMSRSNLKTKIGGRRCPVAQLLAVARGQPPKRARSMIGRSGDIMRAISRIKVHAIGGCLSAKGGCLPLRVGPKVLWLAAPWPFRDPMTPMPHDNPALITLVELD